MDERTILRKAKGVLLERGWHQGGFCDELTGETGAVCLAGAAKVAMFGDPYHGLASRQECVALRAVCNVLMESVRSGSVVGWNDEPGRTFDDVIGLIDRALGSLPAEAPELEKAVA